MMNLQPPRSAAPRTSPAVLLERFERMNRVDLTHQDLQRKIIGKMGSFGDQLTAVKGAEMDAGIGVSRLEPAHFTSNQSLCPGLRHSPPSSSTCFAAHPMTRPKSPH